jgi:hypothetical protein
VNCVLKPLSLCAPRQKHNGCGFGGCWCTWFHLVGRPEGETRRALKERLVREGDAHAALVFDGDAAVAWCQYSSPDELPNIHHRKEYEATRTDELPTFASRPSSSTGTIDGEALPVWRVVGHVKASRRAASGDCVTPYVPKRSRSIVLRMKSVIIDQKRSGACGCRLSGSRR